MIDLLSDILKYDIFMLSERAIGSRLSDGLRTAPGPFIPQR
jgi:hypothetical protein